MLPLTDPTGVHVPLETLTQSRPPAWMLGASVGLGNSSDTERLGASVAFWLTVVESATCGSLRSRVAVTLKPGA